MYIGKDNKLVAVWLSQWLRAMEEGWKELDLRQ